MTIIRWYFFYVNGQCEHVISLESHKYFTLSELTEIYIRYLHNMSDRFSVHKIILILLFDSAGNTCDKEVFNTYLFKHNYANLSIFRFIRFPEHFFATTYHMFIIHSSYLISGFGAGNIFLNILLMPVNYTLRSQHFYFQSILCFIMSIPPNIFILYVITSKLTMSIIYKYI